jgi:hypothetical protein
MVIVAVDRVEVEVDRTPVSRRQASSHHGYGEFDGWPGDEDYWEAFQSDRNYVPHHPISTGVVDFSRQMQAVDDRINHWLGVTTHTYAKRRSELPSDNVLLKAAAEGRKGILLATLHAGTHTVEQLDEICKAYHLVIYFNEIASLRPDVTSLKVTEALREAVRRNWAALSDSHRNTIISKFVITQHYMVGTSSHGLCAYWPELMYNFCTAHKALKRGEFFQLLFG